MSSGKNIMLTCQNNWSDIKFKSWWHLGTWTCYYYNFGTPTLRPSNNKLYPLWYVSLRLSHLLCVYKSSLNLQWILTKFCWKTFNELYCSHSHFKLIWYNLRGRFCIEKTIPTLVDATPFEPWDGFLLKFCSLGLPYRICNC